MGGIPPLPQLQNYQIPAQMGHQGGPPPQAYGTLGGAPQPGAEAAMGIAGAMSKFVESYWGAQEAKKAHYDKLANDALSKMKQGLWDESNIDMETVQKWMKKAGWPVRTEAPTPEEKAYSQQKKQYEAQQSAMAAQPPSAMPTSATSLGATNPALQQLLAQGGGGPPTPPPQAPPLGLLDRMKAGLGIGQPQPSAESPMGQYLRQLSAAGKIGGEMTPENVAQKGRIDTLMANLEEKTGIPLRKMTMDQQQKLLGIFGEATKGNPQAIDMAIRSGVMKGVPIDEAASLTTHMNPGAPPQQNYEDAAKMVMFGHFGLPMMKMQQEWAEKLMPRFAGQGDPAALARQYVADTMAGKQPKVKPGMTLEEMKTGNDAMRSLQEAYTTAPMSWLNAWNTAKLVGDKDAESKISQLISKLPRNGTIAQSEFTQTHNLQEFTAKNDVALRSQGLQLQALDAVLKAQGQEGAEIKMQLDSKDVDIRNAGIDRLRNLDLKGSQATIPIPNPKDPSHPILYQIKDPVSVIKAATNLFSSNENTVAPQQAPPMPGQMPGQPPQTPSKPFDPTQVPAWNRSNPFELPDPFAGLPPELQEVLQMTSHPEFKTKGADSKLVQEWMARQRAAGTGQ